MPKGPKNMSGHPRSHRTVFCRRAARVKGSKLAPAPRMVIWQGPLFCPRSPQVGGKRGPGAPISEAAWSPSDRGGLRVLHLR
jgi:hypothetical protein